MSTFGIYPRRGEMNSRRIYVLPQVDEYIGFFDLSSFGTSPVIRSQSHNGLSCAFMDDDIVVCTSGNTGGIYKYNITNNYDEVKIITNNPSGVSYFQNVLVTKEKHILAAYTGCIYIYDSSGAYIGYSNNSQTYYIIQMKEIRSNIILTTNGEYVYSHDIENNIIYLLLDKDDPKTIYQTLEVLERNTGDIAIGGYYYSGTEYGYVELFHLYEDNSTLLPKSNKRWVGDTWCWIQIIREIQTGVIIFGGSYDCGICTWEYAVVPNKDPICFSIGDGHRIMDIMPLP